jgi:hypothetical protein
VRKEIKSYNTGVDDLGGKSRSLGGNENTRREAKADVWWTISSAGILDNCHAIMSTRMNELKEQRRALPCVAG